MESSRVPVTSRSLPATELVPRRTSHDTADGESGMVNGGDVRTFINYRLDSTVINGSQTSMSRAFEAAQRARSLAQSEVAKRSKTLKDADVALRKRAHLHMFFKLTAIRAYQRLRALETERTERERTIASERAERERSRAIEIARQSGLRALRVGRSDEEEWLSSVCDNITSVPVDSHRNVPATVITGD
ncbi:uncharacterized protein LOC131949018 isoform X2 [Physella acuta]|nr:uncharacterized protein LOC131949018 isoform X2 [Physella acuta]